MKEMIQNNIKVKIIDLPSKSFKNLLHKRKDVLKIRKLISRLVQDENLPILMYIFHIYFNILIKI